MLLSKNRKYNIKEVFLFLNKFIKLKENILILPRNDENWHLSINQCLEPINLNWTLFWYLNRFGK